MAKGKGQRMRASRPGGSGRIDMRAQMQRLQEQMTATQEALAQETVTATAGGGAITVVMTGEQRVHSITIDPEVLHPEDFELLQDLVVAAVNEAIEKSQALQAERMSALTGGLGGLGGLLG